jgi:hypothetical protein
MQEVEVRGSMSNASPRQKRDLPKNILKKKGLVA